MPLELCPSSCSRVDFVSAVSASAVLTSGSAALVLCVNVSRDDFVFSVSPVAKVRRRRARPQTHPRHLSRRPRCTRRQSHWLRCTLKHVPCTHEQLGKIRLQAGGGGGGRALLEQGGFPMWLSAQPIAKSPPALRTALLQRLVGNLFSRPPPPPTRTQMNDSMYQHGAFCGLRWSDPRLAHWTGTRA